MWLRGVTAGLQTNGSLVQSPVKAYAWVAGQVPSRRHVRGNHTLKKGKKNPDPQGIEMGLKVLNKATDLRIYVLFKTGNNRKSWYIPVNKLLYSH